MGENIKITSSEKNIIFVENFLGEYLSRGFGSMSKRDIDVLVMHLLMDMTDLKKESNFNLSIKLKLTEAKVKNLKYEANLKHSKSLDDKIKEDFLLLLNNARLQVVGKETWVSMAVEDTFLRNAIKSKVKENGSFTDSSFNSEIVKISADDFSYLICTFTTDDMERIDIENKIAILLSSTETLEFKDLFKMFLKEATKGAGNELGKQGIRLGVAYVSGTTSILGQIYDTFKSYIESS